METPGNGRLRFGEFEFDRRSIALFHNGWPVKIQPQPLRVLAVLLEHPGSIVSRQELRRTVWGESTFVEFDDGLNYSVRQIRLALGDRAVNPTYIETLPKQGYRFIRDIQPLDDAALVQGAEQPTVISFPPPDRRRARLMLGSAFCGILCMIAAWSYFGRKPSINSLAVLPLANFSGDPAQDYFADGMTDELTTMLAKSSKLRIVSRTSAMQYRSAHLSLREIAKRLAVDGIVEGSVARSGDRVHMTIQLIDARNDAHVWADSFDRDTNDSVLLPGEVAQSLASRLHSLRPQTAPTKHVRPEAYDAYLQGRYLWFTGTNKQAGEYFLKAAQLQPDYALAWAGVADYYIGSAVEGEMRPQDSLPAAKAAALKAISLDESLAQVHVSLCAARFFADWNWPQALQECDRAIELDPEFSEAYHLKAKVLSALQRHEEALQLERKAMELNPFARPWGLALELNWARQFDAAIREARARLESAPENIDLLWGLAYAYRCKGMDSEAAQSTEKLLRASGNPALAAKLTDAFRQGGYKAAARAWLDFWKTLSQRRYVSPVRLAEMNAALGDRKQTLALLEQGYDEHSPLLLDVPFDPVYDFVHGDARYRSIIKKMGLPAP